MTQELIAGNILELTTGETVIHCMEGDTFIGYTVDQNPVKLEFKKDVIKFIVEENYDSTYDDKLEDKRERFTALAQSNKAKSEQAYKFSNKIAYNIPLGQPIMIGTHGEAHARRDAKLIASSMRKSLSLQKKADHFAEKADSIGTGGISSDDPNAPEKYEAKLNAAKYKQEFMKAVNKVLKSKAKKYNTESKRVKALMELGIKESKATSLLYNVDCFGNKGFAPFELTNNGAKVRTTREKLITSVKQKARRLAIKETPTSDYPELGLTVTINYEENRLQFSFDTNLLCNKARKLQQFRGYNRSYNTLQKKIGNRSSIMVYREVKLLTDALTKENSLNNKTEDSK